MVFWTYILHCADGSYYTGHTDHLENRIADHQRGRMPGYTRTRLPVRLAWSQDFPTRNEALQAERQIKGWSRGKKEALIEGRWDEVSRLAKGSRDFVLRQAQDERRVLKSAKINPVRPEPVEGRKGAALEVGPHILDQLINQATQAHPHECCGLLLGSATRITHIQPARNVHPAPQTHFEIDPQALVDAHRAARAGGAQIAGYYHSHPAGPARPSATDAAEASGDGRIWAIVGEGGVTFWRDDKIGFTALSYSAPSG